MLRSFWVVVFFVLGALQTAHASPSQKLRVGFIGALTGPAAAYGNAGKNGFQLAVDELGSDVLEVIYEDDAYSPAKSVAAFKKLIDIDKVDIVLGMSSTAGNAVAPLAEARNIPFFVWANDPKVARGKKTVTLIDQSADAEGAKLASQAISQGYTKIALLSSVGDYQSTVTEGLAYTLKERVIYKQEVPADEKDFRAVLLKTKRLAPEALGLCFHPGQFAMLAKQARELGIKLPIFACNTIQDASEQQAAAGALRGSWYFTLSVSPEFAEKYRARFGETNVLTGAAIYYEMGRTLSEQAENGATGNDIISRLVASGLQKSVAGDYSVREINRVRFFDFPLVPMQVP